jgi:hypothetical protein
VKHFRFSIASLLGLVVFVAIAFAALRAASYGWDSALFSTVVAMLLISVLLAVHRAERKRAFWFGFCLFGGAYLVASLVPQVEQWLLTTKGLTFFDSKVPRRSQYIYEMLVVGLSNSIKQTKTGQGLALGTDARTVANNTDLGIIRLWDSATGKLLSGSGGTSENFLRIGHSLTALVLAFLGGHLSRFMYATSQTRHSTVLGDRTSLPQDQTGSDSLD